MKQACVYILKCSDGSYYTGCTADLESRIIQHQEGYFGGYTAARRPVKLLWAEGCDDIRDAITAERQIKGWSRKKKEALMRGDFDLLHVLAECKNQSHYKNKKKESLSR